MIEGPARAVCEALLYTFVDEGLLTEALTHASWSNEHGGPNNERLEFLGDAVLQLCVTSLLVARFPHAGEGELSRLRQQFVRTEALAGVGRGLGLGPALRFGRGEAASGGADRPRNLAGATEAILGAAFADGGLEVARAIVHRWVESMLDAVEAESRRGFKDAKSRLQERVQRGPGSPAPRYHEVWREGPAHAPLFRVEVRVGDRALGQGSGSSKAQAEVRAAEEALAALARLDEVAAEPGSTPDAGSAEPLEVEAPRCPEEAP